MASAIKKIYTDAFKLTVVKYALEINNYSATARHFDLNPSTVKKWVDDYKTHSKNS